MPEEEESTPQVLLDLRRLLQRDGPSSLFDKSVMATPVAAIKALLGVVQRSKATTMMGLQQELEQAKKIMIQEFEQQSSTSLGRSLISLASGCDLFLKYVTRSFLEVPDFEPCRQEVLERGERFAGISLAARDRIADVASDFIQEGQTVLTHGWSRVVASILLKAAETKHFDIIILEGRPDASGAKAAKFYGTHSSNIPTTVVLDAAMGYVMESVDIVLTGAEAVVENGGCVNKLGTYALAACAKAHGKPFYAAAESYKFARLYPLNQQDLPDMGNVPLTFCDSIYDVIANGNNKDEKKEDDTSRTNNGGMVELPDTVTVKNPPCDLTPANFITLLFTDLGVLTPSAVSDELIRLYQ
jgi:translation initiation factor eIF-2B subunit alpha